MINNETPSTISSLPPIPGAKNQKTNEFQKPSKHFLIVRTDEKLLTTKTKLLIIDLDNVKVIYTIEAETLPIVKGLTATMKSTDDCSVFKLQGATLSSPLSITVADQYQQIVGIIRRKGLFELQEFQILDAANRLLFDGKANNKGFLSMITGSDLFVNITVGNQPVAELKEASTNNLLEYIDNRMDTRHWQHVSKNGDAPYFLKILTEQSEFRINMLFCLMIATRWIRNEGR